MNRQVLAALTEYVVALLFRHPDVKDTPEGERKAEVDLTTGVNPLSPSKVYATVITVVTVILFLYQEFAGVNLGVSLPTPGGSQTPAQVVPLDPAFEFTPAVTPAPAAAQELQEALPPLVPQETPES